MNIIKIQCNQRVIKHNKHFKRDFQRAAFSLCVDFGGFSVVRKLGSRVVSPLSGRYVFNQVQRIMEEKSQLFLQQYLRTLPSEVSEKYTSFSSDYFCADEYNANLCADLILRGEKRASCSMEYWYSHESEVLPIVGHLQVVTNWYGEPICIIEITSVSSCRFNEVTEEFAASEGEGDKSLEWWRKAHWKFFTRECDTLGIEPSEDMLLVLEHFKVVYH